MPPKLVPPADALANHVDSARVGRRSPNWVTDELFDIIDAADRLVAEIRNLPARQ
jgi:hypothetical protein